jgi:hypothetical protein
MKLFSFTSRALARLASSFAPWPPRAHPIPPERLALALQASPPLPPERSSPSLLYRADLARRAQAAMGNPNQELGPEALQRAANDATNVLRQRAAVRTLERLKYTWHGGVEWKPPLGNAPAWVLDEEERQRQERERLHAPTRADALALAMEYAVDPLNADGLEWLRAWSEGDAEAEREFKAWLERRPDPTKPGWPMASGDYPEPHL